MIVFVNRNLMVVLLTALMVTFRAAGQDANDAGFDPFLSGAMEGRYPPSGIVDSGPVIPTIQFANDDIAKALQIISDVTGWSIFPTANASKPKISLWAKGITAKELLDTVVTLAGLIYDRQDNVIRVMTYDEYMEYHGLAKQVIPLTYADATSVAAVIKPFLTKARGKSVVHVETNTIVLFEAEANLKSLAGIIEKLDTPSENIGIEVINLKYADCETLAAILQQVFAGQQKIKKNRGPKTARTRKTGRPEGGGAIKAAGTKEVFIPYEQVGIYCVIHANQLIVVGTKAEIQEVKDLVAMIDVYGDNMVLEVIDLQYADSEMVATTLQQVFSGGREPREKIKSVPGGRRPPAHSVRERPVEAPAEIAGVMFTPQAHVEVYSIGRTNQLIVKAFRSDIEKLKELVKKLDVFVEPTTTNYHFVFVDAAEVYQGLEQILDIYSRSGGSYSGGGARTGRRGYGKESGLTLVERTNSILLTGPPSAHRIMTSIRDSVDVPGMYEAGAIVVYKIQNGDVEEIAATVQTMLESRAEEERKRGEPKVEGPAEGAPEAGPDIAETEEFVPQIEAKVSVNKATNSIVVQATARQHREIGKLITELDIRRKQVLIEAMIIEVTSSDDLDFGVEMDYIRGSGISISSFGLSTIDPVTGVREIVATPGGTGAVLRPNKVQAVMKALATNDNVRIESAPQILVNDNAVGLIQSIAEEPTRQISQGETTTQSGFGEYISAGTQFAITPHISDSNYLRVEYQITLNSFGEKAGPDLPPARNTSTIQSEATVPDGSTIIVGGIQASSESESVDKVPLVGDIPLIGLAFRNTIIRKQYITTYLFITTTIMRSLDFADLEDVSEKALEEVKPDASAQTTDAETEDIEQPAEYSGHLGRNTSL